MERGNRGAKGCIVSLFGPSREEVNAYLEAARKEEGWPEREVLMEEAFGVLRVLCKEPLVAVALIRRFGPAVFSLDGEGLEVALGRALATRGWTMATAESCTGGLIGHLVTNCPGSSNWYKMGFVVYSNEAKQKLLGVREESLARFGAVSRQVVMEMAVGARAKALCDVAVAVSGIAGPGGGSAEKPVGTVWMAVALADGVLCKKFFFSGDRLRIKTLSAYNALDAVRRVAIGEGLEWKD